jgi:hypothetical protein
MSSRGKGDLCLAFINLPTSCADCGEIWEPQTAGTLRAIQGLLYFFFFKF